LDVLVSFLPLVWISELLGVLVPLAACPWISLSGLLSAAAASMVAALAMQVCLQVSLRRGSLPLYSSESFPEQQDRKQGWKCLGIDVMVVVMGYWGCWV
jgi:hypothetical protein